LAELGYRTTYLAARLLCNAVFRPYLRLTVEGQPRLEGPFVVVANHASYLDPVLLGAALRRRCVFMMTDLFYRDPRLQWLYRWFRAIPVAMRGGNREAMRAARAVLERGEVLAMFPEGGISRDGELYLGNPGAVALTLAASVPVVPAAIVGAHEVLGVQHSLPRPRRVIVRFGAPIAASDLAAVAGEGRKVRLARSTERIMTAIADLGGQTTREQAVRAERAARTEQP